MGKGNIGMIISPEGEDWLRDNLGIDPKTITNPELLRPLKRASSAKPRSSHAVRNINRPF